MIVHQLGSHWGKLLFNIIYASYYIALFPLALKFIGGREDQEQGLLENKGGSIWEKG